MSTDKHTGPSQQDLQRLWHELDSCSSVRSQYLLEKYRAQARASLEHAISSAIARAGIAAVRDVVDDVDFRGW